MSAGKLPLQPADDTTSSANDRDDMNNCAGDQSVDQDGASVVLDAVVQAQLGRRLSVYYADLVNQPIPDTFLDLLKKLEQTEKGQ